MEDIDAVEFTIFMVFFVGVSALGFVAARWQRADDLQHLDEWGLGGRNFGSWITWFLIDGDLYTAYTFVAVPALIFGAGAAGFFAVPYTIIVYPLVFPVVVRLWSVSKEHGFVRPADFVRPSASEKMSSKAPRWIGITIIERSSMRRRASRRHRPR